MVTDVSPLKRIRQADPRNLSQAEVARAVGIDAGFYTRLEQGERTAHKDLAEALAGYFGVAVDDIFRPERFISHTPTAAAA